MDKKKYLILAILLSIVLVTLVVITEKVKTSTSGRNGSVTTILNPNELFTTRDLKQEANLSGATKYTIEDNTDIQITKEGVYVLSGTAKNVTIYVEAGDEEKVQLVLDNLNIENEESECIHIESADKVFLTLNSQSSLNYKVTDIENATGAILSRCDLILNGKGTLHINSANNGIVGKDDVKITGGTYNITATKNAIRANDSICISNGTFSLNAGTDGLHAENNDDDTKGYIYIGGGNFTINAGDDAIHAISVAQIDGGTIEIKAAEGIEGTYLQINDGTILIEASDDGMNAPQKSSAYYPTVEINGGDIKIDMGRGDTDGVDSNGDIFVNGGRIEVTGNSTFDYERNAEHNGGTIIINGEETDTIPNQFGGGMPGGFGGFGGGKGGRDFPQDSVGSDAPVAPPNWSGDFGNFEGRTPPDFDGEFDPNMTPPDFDTNFKNRDFPQNMSGDFNGKKPSKGNRQQKIEQTNEQESTENII